MEFKTGDIVRFKREKGIDGLHEVVEKADDEGFIVTRNECNSEFYAYSPNLIFVCSVDDRKDI